MISEQAKNGRSSRKPPFIRRLYFQIVVFGAFALATAILLFTWNIGNEQLDFALESIKTQARTLVSNTASAASNYIVVKDLGGIEEVLAYSATFPDVVSLKITDSKGLVYGYVIRNAQDVIEPNYGLRKIDLPQEYIEKITVTNNIMSLWFPIEQGSLGWVQMEFSLDRAAALQRAIWKNGIITSVFAFVVSIALLILLLNKPMNALSNATKFARGLYKNTGEVMPFQKSAFEIEQLEHALNYASYQIHASSKGLTDIKLALDAHAIVGITDRKGKLTYVNDKFCNISGYTRAELIGQGYDILDSGYHDDAFYKSLRDTIFTGKVWHGEICDSRKDGSVYWVETTIVPFVNKQGMPYQYVGIQTDISDRKEAAQKLRDYQEHLEDKVEERTNNLKVANSELESFCYSVSHDLRAPLRSIDGFSQALLEDCAEQLDEQACDYLDRVRTSSHRMGELIESLLNLSKVVRSDMIKSQVNLSQLAVNVINQLSTGEPERKVDFICAPDLVVSGDERLLLAMLENLLGNAWKFTSRSDQASIELGVVHEETRDVFFIRDNGTGFDEKYMHKMFEPFQRLHSNDDYEGTGIGLATVQRIVRRHGGEVWAESTADNGATIFFELGEPVIACLSKDFVA
ncbi:MAG: PAS domain S-box protein [Sulfuriflexus sp.]|nr:PAS domain S-box protein [Sulfuriflexus sp.]